jgi:hypothetical protein
VNLALCRLAEGNDPRIKPVHQRAQRQKIQFSVFDDTQSIAHRLFTPAPLWGDSEDLQFLPQIHQIP